MRKDDKSNTTIIVQAKAVDQADAWETCGHDRGKKLAKESMGSAVKIQYMKVAKVEGKCADKATVGSAQIRLVKLEESG